MARKGKDLFVLLGERTGKGKSSQKSAGRSQPEAVGGWFRGLFRSVAEPARGGEARGGRRKAMPRGLLVPGWMLGGLLSIGLGAGFVAGRYTASASGDPLHAEPRNEGRKGGMRPGPLGRGSGRQEQVQNRGLDDEKAEERLSNYFFPVLSYAASRRQDALRLANYLREQRLATTRIQKFGLADGGSFWCVICYVKGAIGSDGAPTYSVEDAAGCFSKLKQVPSPWFESRFLTVVKGMTTPEETIRQFDNR